MVQPHYNIRNVYVADGTVLVISPGHDMGQGIATKAKQAAAYALGQALPESQRPFPLDLIHMADNSTDMLPNCGAVPPGFFPFQGILQT